MGVGHSRKRRPRPLWQKNIRGKTGSVGRISIKWGEWEYWQTPFGLAHCLDLGKLSAFSGFAVQKAAENSEKALRSFMLGAVRKLVGGRLRRNLVHSTIVAARDCRF